MIVMAFEKGDLDQIRPFLAAEVFESFEEAVQAREAEGLSVEANFIGLREIEIHEASYDRDSRLAQIAVRFVGELTSVVRNREGQVIEGSPTEVKRQRDIWTFERRMGVDDPNWQLVATGE